MHDRQNNLKREFVSWSLYKNCSYGKLWKNGSCLDGTFNEFSCFISVSWFFSYHPSMNHNLDDTLNMNNFHQHFSFIFFLFNCSFDQPSYGKEYTWLSNSILKIMNLWTSCNLGKLYISMTINIPNEIFGNIRRLSPDKSWIYGDCSKPYELWLEILSSFILR